jgi:hypothetical protein
MQHSTSRWSGSQSTYLEADKLLLTASTFLQTTQHTCSRLCQCALLCVLVCGAHVHVRSYHDHQHRLRGLGSCWYLGGTRNWLLADSPGDPLPGRPDSNTVSVSQHIALRARNPHVHGSHTLFTCTFVHACFLPASWILCCKLNGSSVAQGYYLFLDIVCLH